VVSHLINNYLNKLKLYNIIEENIYEENIYTDLKIQFNFSPEIEKQILDYDLYYNLKPNMEIINDIKKFMDLGCQLLCAEATQIVPEN